jgi:hypothetical protein
VSESPSLSSLFDDVRAILQEARGKRYALRSELSWTHWWHILDWPQLESGETR